MNFSADLERSLRQSVRQARMVAFTCCFVAPAMYAISLGTQVLYGRWALFLGGFGQLPLDDLRVRGALFASGLALLLALGLVPRVGRKRMAGRHDPGAALDVLKLRNLLRSALLAAVAVCGLVVGVKIGPPAASMSLALFLVTLAAGYAVFPSEASWRAVMNATGRGGAGSWSDV